MTKTKPLNLHCRSCLNGRHEVIYLKGDLIIFCPDCEEPIATIPVPEYLQNRFSTCAVCSVENISDKKRIN